MTKFSNRIIYRIFYNPAPSKVKQVNPIQFVLFLIFLLMFTSCSTLVVKFNKPRREIIVPDHFSSIQEAIDHAKKGDIIFIRPGIYSGNILLNKPVSIVGESPEEVIILPDENLNEFGISVDLPYTSI